MKAALSLLTIGIALLLLPARIERERPRAAVGYAERVVRAGLLELPPTTDGVTSIVRGGRRQALVTPLDVAVALPSAVAARALDGDGPVVTCLRAVAGALVPVVLLASIGGVFYGRLRRRRELGLSFAPALGTTLGLVFCTSLVLALRRPDALLLATLALLLLLDLLGDSDGFSTQRHFLQVGLVGATLSLSEPSYTGVALALALLDLLRRRSIMGGRATAVAGALAFVPIIAALGLDRIWEARVAMAPMTSGASIHALYGLLLSPGRSLFLYSPLALAGLCGAVRLWERDRARVEASAVAVIVGLLGIAARADWHGDPAFGPTLVLPLLPLFVEPAALLTQGGEKIGRVVFMGALLAGLMVQCLALGVDVEAWPRLMTDVRAATGAPGWFVEPAADLEFVPQLSPLVGQASLLKAALRGAMPEEPPFLLVVGSDQAETGKPAGLVGWQEVTAHYDLAQLRPNLVLAAAPPAAGRGLLGAAFLVCAAGFVALRRAGRRID